MMTPAQHLAQADLLKQAGNDQLAEQHEMLAKAIAQRDAQQPPPAVV